MVDRAGTAKNCSETEAVLPPTDVRSSALVEGQGQHPPSAYLRLGTLQDGPCVPTPKRLARDTPAHQAALLAPMQLQYVTERVQCSEVY